MNDRKYYPITVRSLEGSNQSSPGLNHVVSLHDEDGGSVVIAAFEDDGDAQRFVKAFATANGWALQR